MKIDIKNIKTNNAFSEETICFTADIFVNGVKTAYAKNDGRGGSTCYNAYENKFGILLEAETYAKSLPSRTYKGFSKPMVIESDLEGIIDEAVDNHFNAKEKAKGDKQLLKHMETDVCFGIPNTGNYKRIGFGKTPLKAIALSINGRVVIEKLVTRIKNELKEGEEILNTNLKELGF